MGRAYKYVILGGGNAAGYAAHEFVKLGVQDSELCIISEEAVAPYERPALSKGYLYPDGAAVRLPAFHTCIGAGKERQLPKWYKEHGIELLLNTRVVAADVHRKQLTTAAGETITYQTLIIATGARVVRLQEFGVKGADAEGIFYLRDLADANRLVTTMASWRERGGGRAVVIGGGYIGMEVTAALALNSTAVTMVFPEPHCMARLFTPEIAEFYEAFYRNKGVTFLKGTVMSTFETDESGKVSAVVLKDGARVECDMVVVGVGIRPNAVLFERQLAMEKDGIRVSGKMRTSSASVYAIGDVAAFPLRLYGDTRRLEHVDHARKSAAHAVQTIMAGTVAGAGAGAPASPAPSAGSPSPPPPAATPGASKSGGDPALASASPAAPVTPAHPGSTGGAAAALVSAAGAAAGSGGGNVGVDGSPGAGSPPATAAAAALKSPGDYDYLPYFYSRVFSLSWQFFGDNVGDCVLFGSFRRRKFGAYWVDKGRVVGAFLEGGSQDEYSAIARVARLRPPVADKARLPELGLGFAMQFAEQPQPGLSAGGGGQAGKGGAGGGGGGLLMAMVPSPLTVQLTAGICVAASVAAVAYLYGKRKKRF